MLTFQYLVYVWLLVCVCMCVVASDRPLVWLAVKTALTDSLWPAAAVSSSELSDAPERTGGSHGNIVRVASWKNIFLSVYTEKTVICKTIFLTFRSDCWWRFSVIWVMVNVRAVPFNSVWECPHRVVKDRCELWVSESLGPPLRPWPNRPSCWLLRLGEPRIQRWMLEGEMKCVRPNHNIHLQYMHIVLKYN